MRFEGNENGTENLRKSMNNGSPVRKARAQTASSPAKTKKLSMTNGPVSMQHASLTEQYVEDERIATMAEEVRK